MRFRAPRSRKFGSLTARVTSHACMLVNGCSATIGRLGLHMSELLWASLKPPVRQRTVGQSLAR